MGMGVEATDRSPAPRRTAAAAAAEGADSTLRSPRGGSWLRAFGFGAALGVVAFAVVALINSRADDNSNVTIPARASSAQPPATVALPPGEKGAKPAQKAAKQPAPKPAPAPAPKPKPAPVAKAATPPATVATTPPAASAPLPAAAKPTTLRCDPIYGGSTSYKVTSSAKSGKPTGCGQAHDVLLGALNGSAPSGWKCKTDTGAAVIATCRSGGKTLTARR